MTTTPFKRVSRLYRLYAVDGVVGVVADLEVVVQRTDPVPDEAVGNPPLGQGVEDHGEMVDPARAQQLGGQEGAAGQRCGAAQQLARQPRRVAVEGLAGD